MFTLIYASNVCILSISISSDHCTVLALNIALRRTDAEWVVVSTTDILPPFKHELDDFINFLLKNSVKYNTELMHKFVLFLEN